MKAFQNRYAIIFLFVLSIFPVFLYLDSLALSSWDESLFAMRAYHMLEKGEFLFNFNIFDSYPGHANRKPPLGTLIQALSWKVFGISELGLRLPISIATLLLVFTPFFMAKPMRLSPLVCFSYGLILLSSTAFIQEHVVRTGDQDVLICFFMFVAALFFYRYLDDQSGGERKNLIFFFLFTALGLYVKTVFAFFFFPGLLLYSLYKRKLNSIVRDPLVWIFGFGLLASFIGYNLYLEKISPGFIKGYLDHSVGRFSKEVDSHQSESLFFYWQYIYTDLFKYTTFFFALTPWLLWKKKENPQHDLLVFTTIVGLCFIGILSFSATKLSWYLVPYFPLGALHLALILDFLLNDALKIRTKPLRSWMSYFCVIILLTPLYFGVIMQINDHKHKPYLYSDYSGCMIKKLQVEKKEEKTYSILTKASHTPQLSFYVTWYNEKKGYNLNIDKKPFDTYQQGAKVLTCFNSIKDELKAQYNLEVLQEWGACQYIKINLKENQIKE